MTGSGTDRIPKYGPGMTLDRRIAARSTPALYLRRQDAKRRAKQAQTQRTVAYHHQGWEGHYRSDDRRFGHDEGDSGYMLSGDDDRTGDPMYDGYRDGRMADDDDDGYDGYDRYPQYTTSPKQRLLNAFPGDRAGANALWMMTLSQRLSR